MTTDLTTTKRPFRFGDITKMFGGGGTSTLRQFGILGSLVVILVVILVIVLIIVVIAFRLANMVCRRRLDECAGGSGRVCCIRCGS